MFFVLIKCTQALKHVDASWNPIKQRPPVDRPGLQVIQDREKKCLDAPQVCVCVCVGGGGGGGGARARVRDAAALFIVQRIPLRPHARLWRRCVTLYQGPPMDACFGLLHFLLFEKQLDDVRLQLLFFFHRFALLFAPLFSLHSTSLPGIKGRLPV